ncbi:MAG: DUF2911 domain-containing protein [Candidatus Longimicrobiales bacterium M2_2A_002]
MTGRTSWLAVLALAASTVMAPGAQAQELTCQPQADVEGRASPYDSVSMTVGTGRIKVCYSRPSLRGRTMIGGEAVPYGQLWRTGANEPTTLHTSVPLSIAGIEVGPGSYSLYTIPREDEDWTLIVNASTSQWGHEGRYPGVQDQDIGRTEVTAESTEETVEQFTIRLMEDGGGLVLEWQNSRVHIPITVG